VAKEAKGSTPIPFMPKGICEGGVQPHAIECVTTDHDLGG
jgi:hypothetical protein